MSNTQYSCADTAWGGGGGGHTTWGGDTTWGGETPLGGGAHHLGWGDTTWGGGGYKLVFVCSEVPLFHVHVLGLASECIMECPHPRLRGPPVGVHH